MSFMCPTCTTNDKEVSFKTLKELLEHNTVYHEHGSSKKEKISVPPTEDDFKRAREELKKPKEDVVITKKEKESLKLKYTWIGTCDCGNQVDTIEIPVDDYLFAVAYCPSCRKQLKRLPVVPIENQSFSKVKK